MWTLTQTAFMASAFVFAWESVKSIWGKLHMYCWEMWNIMTRETANVQHQMSPTANAPQLQIWNCKCGTAYSNNSICVQLQMWNCKWWPASVELQVWKKANIASPSRGGVVVSQSTGKNVREDTTCQTCNFSEVWEMTFYEEFLEFTSS